MPSIPLICVVLACALQLAIAQPDPSVAEAERLFEEGRALARDGKHAEACERFAASLALDYSIGAQLNLADCAAELGRTREAWALFVAAGAAAERAGDARRAEFARGRAAILEAKLVTLVVEIADGHRAELGLSIGGRSLPAAARVRDVVEPGPTKIVATLPGHPPFTRTITAKPGDTVTIAIPSFAPPGAPPAGIDTSPSSGPREIATWSLAGAGGLTALAAGVLAWRASSAYEEAASGSECMRVVNGIRCSPGGDAMIAEAQRTADIATVFTAASALLVGAGAVLYLTRPRDVVVRPVASESAVGIVAGGRF